MYSTAPDDCAAKIWRKILYMWSCTRKTNLLWCGTINCLDSVSIPLQEHLKHRAKTLFKMRRQVLPWVEGKLPLSCWAVITVRTRSKYNNYLWWWDETQKFLSLNWINPERCFYFKIFTWFSLQKTLIINPLIQRIYTYFTQRNKHRMLHGEGGQPPFTTYFLSCSHYSRVASCLSS